MSFRPAPEPKSKLGYYRLLSPTAAVRVSPICLGAMNFGSAWKDMLGDTDKKTTFEILDYFYDQGGNFIDTACNYQNEESEIWLGEWMKERGNRDQIVLATKFSTSYSAYKGSGIHVNSAGNSKKSLHHAVEGSLKKLQSSYIDLLYVHWWDYTTSIEELMQSLNHLVASGKVLYLGVSDTPAWVVSKANQYARDHGLAQFCVYQGQWSILNRDFERDIIPMCKSENMGICPWGALGGGLFKTEEQLKESKEKGEATRDLSFFGGINTKSQNVTAALNKIAKQKGSTITGIALSYVMQKTPYVFPICGGRKVSHLKDNIDALTNVRLTDEDIKELEASSPLDLGFPHAFLGGSNPKNNFLLAMAGKYSYVEGEKPIVLAP